MHMFKIGHVVPEIWPWQKSDFSSFFHFLHKYRGLYFWNRLSNWAKNLVFLVFRRNKLLVKFSAKSVIMNANNGSADYYLHMPFSLSLSVSLSLCEHVPLCKHLKSYLFWAVQHSGLMIISSAYAYRFSQHNAKQKKEHLRVVCNLFARLAVLCHRLARRYHSQACVRAEEPAFGCCCERRCRTVFDKFINNT